MSTRHSPPREREGTTEHHASKKEEREFEKMASFDRKVKKEHRYKDPDAHGDVPHLYRQTAASLLKIKTTKHPKDEEDEDEDEEIEMRHQDVSHKKDAQKSEHSGPGGRQTKEEKKKELGQIHEVPMPVVKEEESVVSAVKEEILVDEDEKIFVSSSVEAELSDSSVQIPQEDTHDMLQDASPKESSENITATNLLTKNDSLNEETTNLAKDAPNQQPPDTQDDAQHVDQRQVHESDEAEDGKPDDVGDSGDDVFSLWAATAIIAIACIVLVVVYSRSRRTANPR